MEELKQEIFDLKQKLKLAASMETTYMDEIEHLKATVKAAADSAVTKDRMSPGDGRYAELFEWEERALVAEQRLAETLAELELEKQQQQGELKERISGNNSSTELSFSCSIDPNKPSPEVLANEVARLQDELTSLESTAGAEKSRLQREFVEMEEESIHLRSYTTELERHLKSVQTEIGDVRAELDAARMLTNSTENSRGNSVYSELDDRRIRAEELIVKQRQRIDQLELASHKTQAEWKLKLAETVQRYESRERERDTLLIEELTRERQRLQDENSKLVSQVKRSQDLQLDGDRTAVKVSKAFQLEENSHIRLIKTLESTVQRLDYQLSEKSASENALRNRFLSSATVRRRLQQELWQQVNTNEQLTKLIQSLKDELQSNRSDEGAVEQHPDEVVKSEPSVRKPLADGNGREMVEPLNPTDLPASATSTSVGDQVNHVPSNIFDPPAGCNPS